MRHPRLATIVAIAVLASVSRPAQTQQTAPRADSVPLRADYRDLAELLEKIPNISAPALDESRALWLGALPLACLDRLQSRPGRGGGRANAPADTSARANGADTTGRAGGRAAGGPAAAANNGAGYFWVPTYALVPDHDRLRAFWGCNDWHSAVGSVWVTVNLLKSFPNSALRELAREKLNAHLGTSNLDGEIAFFHAAAAAINPIPSAGQQGLFERPFGFAWLLELQSALRAWSDTGAKRWAANTAPLAAWMADSLAGYMSKLVEPVRSGSQTNTAQSMTLALDFADAAGDAKLRSALVVSARKLYLADTTCATASERIVPAAGGRGGRGGGGRGAGRGGNADTTARATLPNDLSAGRAGRRRPLPAAVAPRFSRRV